MKSRFLADENVPPTLVGALRTKGYDVKDVKEEGMYGAGDEDILQLAKKERRVVLTHDSDFAFSFRKEVRPARVILIRISPPQPGYVASRFVEIFQNHLMGKRFTVAIVTNEYVRLIRE